MARVSAKTETTVPAKGLIADDDARMRKVIRSIVADLALEIIEAEDGRTAVEAWLLHKPNWLTLDLAMRPVDGLTALREIKSADPLAVIVVVTAYDTYAFREAARLAGARAYVLKDDLWKVREALLVARTGPNPSPVHKNRNTN